MTPISPVLNMVAWDYTHAMFPWWLSTLTMLTSLMKVLLGVWLTFSTLTRGYSAADSAQISQVLFKLHLWCNIPVVSDCSIHHYTRLFKTMFYLFSVFNHTKVMILWSAVQILTFCSVVELLKTALFEWSVKVNNCQTTWIWNHHTCMCTRD